MFLIVKAFMNNYQYNNHFVKVIYKVLISNLKPFTI